MTTSMTRHERNLRCAATLLLCGTWLALAAAVLAVDGTMSEVAVAWPVRLYLTATLIASLVCFTLYGLDKRRAARGQRRIAERTLHLWALGGGWPGAALGGQCFRHKTQKLSFRVVFWLIVLLHATAVTAWLAQ